MVISFFIVGCASNKTIDDQKQNPLERHIVVKMLTQSEGFYRVSVEDLLLFGFSKKTILDGKTFLYYNKTKQPYWLDDLPGDQYITFFVPETASRYYTHSAVLLSNMEIDFFENVIDPVSPDQDDWAHYLNGAADSYLEFDKLEFNEIYMPFIQNEQPFLWKRITTQTPARVEFDISELTDGDFSMSVNLWSNMTGLRKPDHRIFLSLNDDFLGSFSWDGIGFMELNVDLSSEVLKHERNVLDISIPGIDEFSTDSVWLDWIEIRYPRILTPSNDVIKLVGSQDEILINNFSEPVDVYEVVDGHHIRMTSSDLQNGSTWRGEVGKKYWIVGNDGYRVVTEINDVSESIDFVKNLIPGVYTILAPEPFINELRPLIELRESQGLSTSIMPIHTLFDAFTNGNPDPVAITDYLKWLLKFNLNLPKYIFIVGGFSYDPQKLQIIDNIKFRNSIPSYFVHTEYGGETVSDIPFSIVDFNQINNINNQNPYQMDISIGRLPAFEEIQVKNYVTKVIEYEKNLKLNDTRDIVAIVDNTETSFSRAAVEFLEVLGDEWASVYDKPIDSFPLEGSNNPLVTDMVVYYGHGSIQQWGKNELISVEQISNGESAFESAFILQFTCLSGYFIHPETRSLSENFLWNRESLTVATIAPTSLTLPVDQGVLSRSLAYQLNRSENERVGELFLSAWNNASFDSPKNKDLLMTFLLLGDPAIILP